MEHSNQQSTKKDEPAVLNRRGVKPGVPRGLRSYRYRAQKIDVNGCVLLDQRFATVAEMATAAGVHRGTILRHLSGCNKSTRPTKLDLAGWKLMRESAPGILTERTTAPSLLLVRAQPPSHA